LIVLFQVKMSFVVLMGSLIRFNLHNIRLEICLILKNYNKVRSSQPQLQIVQASKYTWLKPKVHFTHIIFFYETFWYFVGLFLILELPIIQAKTLYSFDVR
jgi:hypothetical protein